MLVFSCLMERSKPRQESVGAAIEQYMSIFSGKLLTPEVLQVYLHVLNGLGCSCTEVKRDCRVGVGNVSGSLFTTAVILQAHDNGCYHPVCFRGNNHLIIGKCLSDFFRSLGLLRRSPRVYTWNFSDVLFLRARDVDAFVIGVRVRIVLGFRKRGGGLSVGIGLGSGKNDAVVFVCVGLSLYKFIVGIILGGVVLKVTSNNNLATISFVIPINRRIRCSECYCGAVHFNTCIIN